MDFISKAKVKFYKSLKIKKYREKYNFFLAEGSKIVTDLIRSGAQTEAIITEKETLRSFIQGDWKFLLATKAQLKELSSLKTLPDLVAIMRIPEIKHKIEDSEKKLFVALDNIQDPGNLGTIIRTCDWFGIHELICSKETVDAYNAKVVQATMGSLMRINIRYTDLHTFILEAKEQHNLPVYGTFMNGKNIYRENLSGRGIIVMGNEGKGISHEVGQLIDEKLSIPCFSKSMKKPESLNVAMATSIICSEFKRKHS